MSGDPEFSVQNLADYGHVFNRIVPGAHLGRHPLGGVKAEWHCQVTYTYDRVVSVDDAEQRIGALAEQMRLRAIRELGLEPILEAQRAEVREFKAANMALSALADQRAKKITELQERIDQLTSDGWEDGDSA